MTHFLCFRYEDMRSTSGSGGGGTDSVWMNSANHNHWKQQHSTGDKVCQSMPEVA